MGNKFGADILIQAPDPEGSGGILCRLCKKWPHQREPLISGPHPVL